MTKKGRAGFLSPAHPFYIIWIPIGNDLRPTSYPTISIICRRCRPKKAVNSPPTHVIHRAVQWKKMLEDWDAKSLTQIAKIEGLGQPIVSQIMNLLKLPAEVQEFLSNLDDPREIRKYSERKLREFLRTKSDRVKAGKGSKNRTEEGASVVTSFEDYFKCSIDSVSGRNQKESDICT